MEQNIKNVESLIEYIPYFEDKNKEIAIVVNHHNLTYMQYEDKFEQFIHTVYQSNLLMDNYVEYLAIYEKYQDDYNALIKEADFDTLRAILTGFIEQEKIHEGLWRRAFNEDIFLHLLKSFKRLLDMET